MKMNMYFPVSVTVGIIPVPQLPFAALFSTEHDHSATRSPVPHLPCHGTQSSLCVSAPKVCRQFVPGEPQPTQKCPVTELCFLPREVVETCLLETFKKYVKVALGNLLCTTALVVLSEQLHLIILGVFSNLNNTVNKLHSLVLLFQPWHSQWCSAWIKAHNFMYIFVRLPTTTSEWKQENGDKL